MSSKVNLFEQKFMFRVVFNHRSAKYYVLLSSLLVQNNFVY